MKILEDLRVKFDCAVLSKLHPEQALSYADRISKKDKGALRIKNNPVLSEAMVSESNQYNMSKVLDIFIGIEGFVENNQKSIESLVNKASEYDMPKIFDKLSAVPDYWESQGELLTEVIEASGNHRGFLFNSICKQKTLFDIHENLMDRLLKGSYTTQVANMFITMTQTPDLCEKYPEVPKILLDNMPLNELPWTIKKAQETKPDVITKDSVINMMHRLADNKETIFRGHFVNRRKYSECVIDTMSNLLKINDLITPEVAVDSLNILGKGGYNNKGEITEIVKLLPIATLVSNNYEVISTAVKYTDTVDSIKLSKSIPEEDLFNEETGVFNTLLSNVKDSALVSFISFVPEEYQEQDWVQESISSELKNRGILKYDMFTDNRKRVAAKLVGALTPTE